MARRGAREERRGRSIQPRRRVRVRATGRRVPTRGLEIAKSKSECYSRELGLDLRGDPGRPRDLVDDGDGVMREKFPLGVAYRDVDCTERIGTHEEVAKTPGLSDRNILGCGIVVAGVPIGDREYVRVQLAGTALATKSKIETIQLKLRPESIHALHVLDIFCL